MSLPDLPDDTPHEADAADGSPVRHVVRKPVNTLAITPKSTRITALGRKSYNVLLHHAQDQGLDKDVFRAPLESVVKALDFDSNDHALIKKHLRAMVSTLVEWNSPTTGEGSVWNVSGLLAHASLTKERGQVWLEWSYAVNLKQELLDPAVFARLRLDVVRRLHTHAGIVLYEICTRYRDVGRTARQPWRWWWPVLSGNPPSDKLERLAYRIFKRDTLRPAIAEVCSTTELDVELVEHRKGRQIDEIQFLISRKRAADDTTERLTAPIDAATAARAQSLGIGAELLSALAAEHGPSALASALDALEKRMANRYPQPLRDPARYLRSLLGAGGDASGVAVPEPSARPETDSIQAREAAQRQRLRWHTEWTRRAHERCAAAIEALSPQIQRELEEALMAALRERQAHPSIIKRLAASGWQHPMVRHEMLRFFGDANYPSGWDTPSPDDLLGIAAELTEIER